MADLENRVTELEIRLAYQEATIETLNQSVIAQQRRIDELTLQLQRLSDRLAAAAPSLVAPPSEETPPPHY